MLNTKDSFIQLALSCQALTFGEYTLKSGRLSPYFFNAGLFYQGESLKKIGQFYAETWIAHHLGDQQIFGPAYKGFTLATATAIALADHGVVTSVTFNRKEPKLHGEGGALIGAPLKGQTVIVDDVITAGTAFREAQTFITEHGGQVSSVIIALDRCEHGLKKHSAIQDIQAQGINVYSIINLFDLIDYLRRHNEHDKAQRLQDYQNQFK